MKTAARIALVEDNVSYRRRLADILGARPGWRVVATCGDVHQASQEIPANRPDLVLLDLRLPGGSAIGLLRQLRARLPGIPLIMLTVVDDPEQIVSALESGASGYILKGGSVEELISDVEDALAGGATMSPAVARRLVEWFQRGRPLTDGALDLHGLTDREWEILRLAARGKQQGEIAMSLDIAVNTVKNHFRNIYAKLEVRSLTEALVKLNEGRGLLDVQPLSTPAIPSKPKQARSASQLGSGHPRPTPALRSRRGSAR